VNAPEVRLRRALRLPDVVLFFVVAVIGLRWIATAAAAGPSGLVLWVVALITFFLPLGFAVIELASRHPEEGGIYVWARYAFGDLTAFMTGWLYWVSNVVYMPGLLYFGAANALYAFGPAAQVQANNPYYFILVSLVGLALAWWLNAVGAGVGKWLSNLGGIATWIPAAVLVALGVIAFKQFGSATPLSMKTLVPHLDFGHALLWSTIAFGFAGLEAASLMGDEIDDPRRTVPRAIVLAGISIAAIYILGTLAVLVALPQADVTGLSGILQATDHMATVTGWSTVTPAMALLVAFGCLGGAGAWLASTSRLPFVAGIDRYLPPAFGRLHPRWGTPHVALGVQAAAAGVIAILGQAGATVKGAYDALVAMGVITYFIPYLVLFAAYARAKGNLRTPGGRPVVILLATLGGVTTAVALVLAAVPPSDAPDKMWAVTKVVGGSAVLAVIGAFLFARRRRDSVAVQAPRD
jgi:amino acid transporter